MTTSHLLAAGYLCLNKEQHAAVHYPPDVPLQILAGPGSGKTKVLTSRVAHLVQEKGIPPSQICAVTFTNKAANEMRERLTKLIGAQNTNALKMGTFHALCAKFLRIYGSHISLPNNFTICDAEESKKIVTKILKDYADDLASQFIQLKETAVLATISKAKAKGLSPHEVRRAKTPTDPVQEAIARVYEDYAKSLKDNNSLDFDDLLVFGVKLFTKEPKAVAWCRHVLVDEFQDTNMMQYELMVRLASTHGCVTVVGDPDQSIYGWRSAEVTNLARMHKDFPKTQQILLEENYRSTGSILAASLAIVSQDKSRIVKSLRTSHPTGPLPTLRTYNTEQAEAEFIAQEIKRLVAYSGGMLHWNDFVVLLRFNALSRVVEAALRKEGIPNRILAGQRFFERLEIKDILAYLQVIDNPSYTPAFNRAAHTPPRGIGEKSISELTARGKKLGISAMELAERIYVGKTPDIKPAIKRKLEKFVKPIMVLRKMANEGAPVPDLIHRLVLLIGYEDHLKKSQQDWETRWENVQELINFASQSEAGTSKERLHRSHHIESHPSVSTSSVERNIINLVSEDEDEEPRFFLNETPLRTFLQASMLSTDTETHGDDKATEKVTISTCHSAKGLEWPVVFIPAVEQGTYPFYRTEDVEEERRLLYVACTRAQGLLYLSHSTRRMVAGEFISKELSEFLSKLPPSLFSPTSPALTLEDRYEFAKLINREPIKDELVQRKIREYDKTTRSALHGIQMQATAARNGQLHGHDPYLASISAPNGSSASFSCAKIRTRSPTSSSGAGFANSSPSSSLRNAGINSTDLNQGFRTTGYSVINTSIPSKHPPGFVSHALPSCSSPPVLQISLPHSESDNSLPYMKSFKIPDDTSCRPSAQSVSGQGQSIKLAAGKKRLGMGRLGTNGYPNKKSKGS